MFVFVGVDTGSFFGGRKEVLSFDMFWSRFNLSASSGTNRDNDRFIPSQGEGLFTPMTVMSEGSEYDIYYKTESVNTKINIK